MRVVGVCLDGFRQGMKGAPLEFGGHSFQEGFDSCVAWGQTNMPKTTYQCIPSMFYGLCLIQESVLYKQDMRDNSIQAHRIQRSPMQSAAVESVNTAVPSILEGPKSSVLKDPKHDFGGSPPMAKAAPMRGLKRVWREPGSKSVGRSTCFWVEALRSRGSCKRCSRSTRSTPPQSSSRSSPSTTTRSCPRLGATPLTPRRLRSPVGHSSPSSSRQS